jgi:hypothetical protein
MPVVAIDPAIDWSDKDEIFAKSYAETLAAIKHQDDKVGRVITALAFLTGAAFGLFSKFGTENFSVTLPGSAVSVPAFCFVTFAIAVGLSLAFAVAAVGPTRGLPALGGAAPRQPASLIYFNTIAQSPATWMRLADISSGELKKLLAADYHLETLGLARRVRYKLAWSREAGACLLLAVTALVVLAIFLSSAFSVGTRWWIASGALLAIASMTLLEYVYMAAVDYPEKPSFLWSYVVLLLVLGLAAALLLTATISNTYWYALPYALFGAILMPRLALIHDRAGKLILVGTAAVGLILGGLVLAQ